MTLHGHKKMYFGQNPLPLFRDWFSFSFLCYMWWPSFQCNLQEQFSIYGVLSSVKEYNVKRTWWWWGCFHTGLMQSAQTSQTFTDIPSLLFFAKTAHSSLSRLYCFSWRTLIVLLMYKPFRKIQTFTFSFGLMHLLCSSHVIHFLFFKKKVKEKRLQMNVAPLHQVWSWFANISSNWSNPIQF